MPWGQACTCAAPDRYHSTPHPPWACLPRSSSVPIAGIVWNWRWSKQRAVEVLSAERQKLVPSSVRSAAPLRSGHSIAPVFLTRPAALSSVMTRRPHFSPLGWQRRCQAPLPRGPRVACASWRSPGCDVVAVLKATHIMPYRGEETNHPSNGLLLRADLHTLFDVGLLTIDPKTMTVRLAAN